MPMETDTIEFNANVKGDWFSLSHSLSHDGGNGSRFSYENQEPNPDSKSKLAQRKLFADDRNFILWPKMILQPTETMEW
jgi:hypothetical protein